MKWQIGDVEIVQIVEMEGGELIQNSIPKATPENIKKFDWLYPHFADPVTEYIKRQEKA